MAWDWDAAISSGLAGAGAGAAFSPIGAGIGLGLGFLGGGFFGGTGDPGNINPYSQQAWDYFSGNADPSNPTGYYQQLQDSFAQGTPTVTAPTLGLNQYLAGLEGFDPMSAQMDPREANRYFLSQYPAFQKIAQENFNWDAAEAQANRASSQAIRDIAGQFGNAGAGALRSGAAMQALSEGAINPILQYQQQRAQMVGNQAGALQNAAMGNITSSFNTAGQLGMQGQGLRLNALQSLMQNQAQRNALQAQLQQQAALANADMQYGQQQQQSQLLAQLLGQQYAGMSGQAMPEWYAESGADVTGGLQSLLDGYSTYLESGGDPWF